MKSQDKKGTLKKVIKYLKKYIWLFALSILFAAVTVLTTLYLPILIGDAVDGMLGAGKVNFPGIKRILFVMGGTIAITMIAQWFMSICNNYMVYHIVADVRKDAFHKLQKIPLAYLDQKPYGEFVSRMIADVDQFADGLLMGFTQLFTGVITIITTLVFMFLVNVKITLVVVVITPISLIVASVIAKKTYLMFQKQSITRGMQTSFINEMIGNQKTIQAFSRQDENKVRFDEINKDLQDCSLKAIFFSSLTNPSTRFVNSLVYTGVGITGALSAVAGGISVGQLTCFLSYANQYTKPFNEISGVITELQNALACAGRVFEFIEAKSEPEDKPEAISIKPTGQVDISHVDFSYTHLNPLIQDFNLKVNPGERVAIVGPTGCGKTTIINLLMRFYDCQKGSIFMNGVALQDMTRKSLRASYGMVLQETWLREGTVRENITMGKPDATMEEVIAAAKAAHAHSFIKRLQDGYDTMLGEDGGSLSVGQKQLLCITRVMLCLPPMLILDEATSSIDTRTEQRIQKAFGKMMRGRTSFIVAHRLSTIKEADVILVMKDGHVVEQGNHQELMLRNGTYAGLVADSIR